VADKDAADKALADLTSERETSKTERDTLTAFPIFSEKLLSGLPQHVVLATLYFVLHV